jgi:membrane-bound lytic murein transglycosylase D
MIAARNRLRLCAFAALVVLAQPAWSLLTCEEAGWHTGFDALRLDLQRSEADQARENADLWSRLRASFRLDHAVHEQRVQQELRWLRRHPQYLAHLADRMDRHLAYIHGEVVDRGLPGELALLPIVESALDPYAFSPGGAAGLWQFIPATAERFGLARNYWYDGRRDPLAATAAALDYLEYLHGLFDDWPLAIAGYNAGEGNVRRALRRADTAEPVTFWAADLPRETSAYVPRVLALAALLADPGRYGTTLPDVTAEPPFQVVELGGQFDLQRVAEILDLELDTLYAWNPALDRWATPPAGPHRLVLPKANLEDAADRLAAVPPETRVRWLRVVVREGDTLGHIAQRHGTDVATLRRSNGLGRSSFLRIGQALLVPKSAAAVTANPRLARQGGGRTHVVVPGDSLWRISRSYDVALDRLVRVNRIAPDEPLRPGQRLIVPGTGGTAGIGRSADVTRKITYGVRRGDSLARIASRFQVAVDDITSWNGIDRRDYLQPGQRLELHVTVVGAD